MKALAFRACPDVDRELLVKDLQIEMSHWPPNKIQENYDQEQLVLDDIVYLTCFLGSRFG